jgi:hypothetical protein
MFRELSCVSMNLICFSKFFYVIENLICFNVLLPKVFFLIPNTWSCYECLCV